MTELINDNTFIETETKETSFGTVILLKAGNGISHKEQISTPNGITVLASNVNGNINGLYKLVYTVIDPDGTVSGNYAEIGILPTLFISPSNEVWASITVYDPDKDLEVSLPVFNRANYTLPKPGRPFVGNFAGTTNDSAFFIDVDPYANTKPDKLLRIEFKDQAIKKKHNLKIALPRGNKISISENEVHLLAFNQTNLLHRQIDNDASVIRQRTIDITDRGVQIVTLSFTNTSILFGYTLNGAFSLIKIDANGNMESKDLLNIHQRIYSMWPCVKLGDDAFILKFTTESGNGWMVVKNEEVAECFLKQEKEYCDVASNEKIELGYENLAISGLSRITETAYLLTFYPITDRGVENDTLIVLKRQLK